MRWVAHIVCAHYVWVNQEILVVEDWKILLHLVLIIVEAAAYKLIFHLYDLLKKEADLLLHLSFVFRFLPFQNCVFLLELIELIDEPFDLILQLFVQPLNYDELLLHFFSSLLLRSSRGRLISKVIHSSPLILEKIKLSPHFLSLWGLNIKSRGNIVMDSWIWSVLPS